MSEGLRVTFALPSDPVAWCALLLAAALLAPPSRRLFSGARLAPFTALASLAAAVVSALWVDRYLRGGPRIIDATSYLLEARGIAAGQLRFELGELPTAVTGRFLVRDALSGGDHVAVIFPPGYPAFLAPFVAAGLPMAAGPVLAAVVTALTIELARRLSASTPHAEVAPRLAGALSVVCAALRYHTADTMSHGLAAACATGAIVAALAWRSSPAARVPRGAALALGVALGVATATRPVSGAALAVVCALIVGRRARLGPLALVVAGALPGLGLLLAHQRLATGGWGASSQSLYYALSDGPPGCFGLRFGTGVGCLEEHGDFVRHNLPRGYGAWEALATTARRLKMHAVDPLNAEPLALLIGLPALVVGLRSRATRAVALAIPLFVVAYAPFYFDGNYPGGGARFFADVLPIEHVLVAVWVPLSAPRLRSLRLGRRSAASCVVGLALAGFGLRAHVDHEALRDREGGRPMFEAELLERAGIERGLVFVATDHGFSIGHDPSARADAGQLEVARLRGDVSDRWLFEARGAPATWRYDYDVSSGAVRILPWEPAHAAALEAESLWPALRQSGGWAAVRHPDHACVSGRRAVALLRAADAPASVELALPARLRGQRIEPWLVLGDGPLPRVELSVDGRVVGRSTPEGASDGSACVRGSALDVPPDAGRSAIVLTGEGAGPIGMLDRLQILGDPARPPRLTP